MTTPRYSIVPSQPTGYPLVAGRVGLWSVVKEDNTVVNLNSFGALITGYQGAGQNPFNTVRTPLGLTGGSFYQRTTDTERTITLVVIIQNGSFYRIQNIRQQMINLLAHDSLSQTAKNLKLRFQQVNSCGVATGIPLDCPVVFLGGLGGDVAGLFEDRFALQFLELNPPGIVETSELSTSWAAGSTALSGGNGYVSRNSVGLWSTNQVGSGAVNAFAESFDGTKLLLARATGVYDNVLGNTATNSFVYSVLYDYGGAPIAGGAFTTPINRLMRYVSGAWAAMGENTWDNDILAIENVPSLSFGLLHVGGSFTFPRTRYAMMINSSGTVNPAVTYPLLSGSPNATVRVIKRSPSGKVFAGGDFTAFGATALNRICQVLDTPAVAVGVPLALGTGMNNVVRDIAFRANGNVVAVGDFTTAGGVTVNYIAEWDGTQWKALGSGLSAAATSVAVDSKDRVHVIYAGSASSGNATQSLVTNYAIWNGSGWVSGDINFNTTVPTRIKIRADGTIVINSVTSTIPARSSVVYSGTAPGHLRVEITATAYAFGRVFRIDNFTTGKTIFLNTGLADNEKITIDITTTGLTATSNLNGNVLASILPGSDIADFGLKALTTNVLGILSNKTATFNAFYRNTHNSFDASAG